MDRAKLYDENLTAEERESRRGLESASPRYSEWLRAEREKDMKTHPSITPKRVSDAVKRQIFGTDNPGFCISCGEEQDCCEPDAQHYECESCGAKQVFGAEFLLFSVI
jgi:hypothetical protein